MAYPTAPDVPETGISPLAICRNGSMPDAARARRLLNYLHAMVAGRGKVHAGVYMSGTDAAHWTTDTVVFRTLGHTSPNLQALRCDYVLAPAGDTTTATLNPTVYWTSQVVQNWTEPLTLDSAVTQGSVAVYRDAPTTPLSPYAFQQQSARFTGIEADTTYAFELHTSGKARVISACLYEETNVGRRLDTSTDQAMDPSAINFYSPILARDPTKLWDVIQTLWKRGGSQLFSWASHNGVAKSRFSAVFANALDQTVTSWSSTSPGFYAQTGYRGRMWNSNVPVISWAYAQVAGAESYVAFVRDGGLLGGIVHVDTSDTGYYWTASNMTSANAAEKVDVHFCGDGSYALSLYAAGMFEYQS